MYDRRSELSAGWGERQITLCRNAVHELLGVIDIELPNSMPLM
jgi:hypothetical protein